MAVATRHEGHGSAETLRGGNAAAAGAEGATRYLGPTELSRMHHRDELPKKSMRTPFVPLGLLTLALLIWVGFQAVQLTVERQRLAAILASQDGLVLNSQKLRASLDSLATETAKLADQGNPNARLLDDQLRQRGVTINPQAGK